MKSKKIILLATIATLVFSANLFAQQTITFTTTDGSSILTQENITPYPTTITSNFIATFTDNVLEIGNNVFVNNGYIVGVLGNNVNNFSGAAFWGCSSLQTVDIPNVITIETSAFDYCTSLESINFPLATTIESYAFYGCISLESISFPLATTIGMGAFWNCSSLEFIDFPNVITIEYSAFTGCSSLQTIDFLNVITIGNAAFWGCSSLQTVDIPSATTIGQSAFAWCPSLEFISLGTSFTEPTEIKLVGSSATPPDYPSFDETNTENICLTLGEYVLPKRDDVDTNLWNTYIWKCIESSIKEPSQLASSQIYPNPASDKTTLTLELASTCNIQIELVDILGQEVMQIYEGLVEAGSFSKSFNTAKLAKGIYLVKIIIGSEYKLEKLVIE